MAEQHWDYIIVGGGSGGATLAARLSEEPHARVLLLEAGTRDYSPIIHIPGLLGNALMSRTINWHYGGEPDPSLGGRSLVWMGGRVLGGSSSINGMVFGRGLPADYDHWAALGNAGWSYADLLPYFRKLETWHGPASAARGTSGPVQVRLFEEPHAACVAAMASFVAAGVPYVADYSAGIDQGIGLTQATQRGGWRHSAATAYLKPARARPNLTVLTMAYALKLELDGGLCTGVTYEHDGQIKTAHASREVILAAGAIGTPKLLMLSGVGARAALAPHGIAMRHHLPGVGQHLNEHVNVKISAHTSTSTYNSARMGMGKVFNGMRWLVDRRGPASSPANHCQGFIKTDARLASADVQVQLMAFAFNDDPQDMTDGISAIVSLCQPEVRGQVSLSGADAKSAPRIQIKMLDSETDFRKLIVGARFAADRLGAMDRQFQATVLGPRVRTDKEWRDFIRKTAGLNWHPTSTCRMGATDQDVVDPGLRVHGLRGLSIADASVMPTVTSANTNVPVIAIAEKAADLIRARAH